MLMRVSSNLTWVFVLGCAGLASLTASSAAAAEANPYSVISDRNMFHLNPPPPPPDKDPPKPVDLPKVMLTGFVGKGHSVKVLLAIPPKDNKGHTDYLTLSPGEKGGEQGRNVELVSIRLDKEEVDIINSGTLQTLSVRSNSYASSPPAPAAAMPVRQVGGPPGMPSMPGLRRPINFSPPTMPSAPAAAAAPGGGSAIIAGERDTSSSMFNGSSGGAIVSGGSPNMPMGPGSGVPGNNVASQIVNGLFNQNPGAGAATYQPTVPAGPPVPLVQQAANMLLHEQAGGPPAPPMEHIGE